MACDKRGRQEHERCQPRRQAISAKPKSQHTATRGGNHRRQHGDHSDPEIGGGLGIEQTGSEQEIQRAVVGGVEGFRCGTRVDGETLAKANHLRQRDSLHVLLLPGVSQHDGPGADVPESENPHQQKSRERGPVSVEKSPEFLRVHPHGRWRDPSTDRRKCHLAAIEPFRKSWRPDR